MNLDCRYAPRADVASEVIEGEAVIIDLATGVYFSLDGVGGRIWDLLAARRSGSEILDVLVAEYDVDAERARVDLADLLEQLLAEGIVAPGAEDGPVAPIPGKQTAPRAPYEPPRFAIYRDMGDLLALDPPAPGLSEIPWNAAPTEKRDGQ